MANYVYKFKQPVAAFVPSTPIEELFGRVKKACYHNILEKVLFAGQEYVVRIVKTEEDVKYLITKAQKDRNALIAWDAEKHQQFKKSSFYSV